MLVLVVGPSGVGKDSVINWARETLDGLPDVVFARRTITRRADAGGEEHEACSAVDFDQRIERGDFLLWWRSHGLGYGLPARLRTDLGAGRVVVANTSRTVVADAARLGTRVVVAHLVSAPGVIAARLAARGREEPADIAERLARQPDIAADGVPVIEIRNDGPLHEAGQHLVDLITGLRSDAQTSP
jgi:phosphonate metabolism protein PhnN/1,5-bisphosphokinase (PRPP-forming)